MNANGSKAMTKFHNIVGYKEIGVRTAFALFATAIGLALWPAAAAANFSPRTSITLSDYHAKAIPQVTRTLSQQAGERDIAKVTYKVPAGFGVATYNTRLESGEVLGEGWIKIATPPCIKASPLPVRFKIYYQEPYPYQIADGVKGIWALEDDLGDYVPYTLRGSKASGWTLSARIPQEDLTCAPLLAKAWTYRRSSVTHTPITTNPSTAGSYVFKSIFTSEITDQTVVRSQTVKITSG